MFEADRTDSNAWKRFRGDSAQIQPILQPQVQTRTCVHSILGEKLGGERKNEHTNEGRCRIDSHLRSTSNRHRLRRLRTVHDSTVRPSIVRGYDKPQCRDGNDGWNEPLRVHDPVSVQLPHGPAGHGTMPRLDGFEISDPTFHNDGSEHYRRLPVGPLPWGGSSREPPCFYCSSSWRYCSPLDFSAGFLGRMLHQESECLLRP